VTAKKRQKSKGKSQRSKVKKMRERNLLLHLVESQRVKVKGQK
jgi:hypothetical protein